MGMSDTGAIDGRGMLRRLVLDTIIDDGYVNLRCHPEPGCPVGLNMSQSFAPDDYHSAVNSEWRKRYQTIFPGKPLPEFVATGCCAQFAVSSQRIRERPVEFYDEIRQWILDTRHPDHITGRVMEYMWHGKGIFLWIPTSRVLSHI